ncbi:hypothetical protein [Spiroplasma endosymbiont of Danaus chrysippus]|nr:hypothetical protein [Spiroplasma endosymbiont of Danaus chrysippus]
MFVLSNVNICINLNPINKQKAKKQLDNALSKSKTNEQYALTPSQKSESEQYYNAFLDQQQAIIDDVDFLKDMSIFIIAYGNKTTLNNTKRQLIDLANTMSWKYNNLLFLQQDSLLASYTWTNHIAKITDIEMTCDTFATSFPIPDMPLKDEQGFLLAETNSGKPVIWDLFKKNSQRINHNMVILGESGSGKSFTTKKILLNQAYQNNRKIFILDPEREFTNLTNCLNGQVVNGSGAKGNIINPLEIYLEIYKLDNSHDNADTFNSQLSLLEAFFVMLYPAHKVSDVESPEYIAKVFGTRTVEKITKQYDTKNKKSSKGSIREVEEYIVHPNDLKCLKTGQAYCKILLTNANQFIKKIEIKKYD